MTAIIPTKADQAETQPHSPPQVLERLTTTNEYGARHPDSEIYDAIDFLAKDRLNYVAIETSAGTKHILYTKPIGYPWEDREERLIDVCIIADSREEAERVMEKRIKASDVKKAEATKYVNEVVIPQLAQISEILGVIGRGDIYDPERATTGRSDVDLVLLVNFSTLNQEGADSLIQQLQLLQGDFSASYSLYKIKEGGVRGEGDKPLVTNTGAKEHLSLDVISYQDFSGFLDYLKANSLKGRVQEYNINLFTNGPVLLDSNGDHVRALQEMIRIQFNR